MKKTAFVYALLAECYIIAVVFLIRYGLSTIGESDTILIPMGMLSLFVLSAAMMGYIFLSKPVQLYLEGQKKEAVNFFLSTAVLFAVITGIVFLILFSQFAL